MNLTKFKITIKELVAIVTFIAAISGTYFTMQVRQDNLEKNMTKLETSINDKLKRIETRTDKIYEILINID